MTEKKKLMSDRVLDEGSNFILVFPTESGHVGSNEVTVGRGFFFKVLSWDRFLMVYDDVADLAAAGSVDYAYLGSTGHGTGNDLLRIKDDEWWLYHVGAATTSGTLRMYRRLSGRLGLGGLEYSDATEPDPTAPDDFGYIHGAEIENVYDPPIYTEMMCWYTGKTDSPLWEFGFYNEGPASPVRVVLAGRQYKVIPITKESVQNEMIAGRIPRTIISAGGLRMSREAAFIPDDWKGFNERRVAFTELTGVVCERGM